MGQLSLLGQHLGVIDARRLVFPLGIMVKNTSLSNKQLSQLMQRLSCKALIIPVNFVVAENYMKAVDLVRRQRPPGESVDFFQVFLCLPR